MLYQSGLSVAKTLNKPLVSYGSIVVAPNTIWAKERESLDAFKAGTLAAKSLGHQRRLLANAKKFLAQGNVKLAKNCLDSWKLERSYHAHIIGLIG